MLGVGEVAHAVACAATARIMPHDKDGYWRHIMTRQWTQDEIMELSRAYMPAAIVAAAADLDLFAVLNNGRKTADDIADALAADRRATTILLDALTALKVLDKGPDGYALADGLAPLVTEEGPRSILAMLRRMGLLSSRPWTTSVPP
jgi:hypothetical protein